MEWATKKKGFPEVLVGEVMSLYEGQKTKFQDTRGMGNEKEGISGSIGWRSDEPV